MSLHSVTEQARRATAHTRDLEAQGRALCPHVRIVAACPECSEAWREQVAEAHEEAERLHGERLLAEAEEGVRHLPAEGWHFQGVSTALLWMMSGIVVALWTWALFGGRW